MKKLLALFACMTLLTLASGSTNGQTLITFDDLSETGSGTWLSNGYQGLNWENFLCINSILNTAVWHRTDAVYYGMVSVSNVVEGFGGPLEISSSGTNFDFLSAHLTTQVSSNVEVQGFRGPSLIYDQIVSVAHTNPSFYVFNFSNIDRVSFGLPYYDGLVMDNISIQFIPEPATILLAAIGALLLVPVLKQKRGGS